MLSSFKMRKDTIQNPAVDIFLDLSESKGAASAKEIDSARGDHAVDVKNQIRFLRTVNTKGTSLFKIFKVT